MPLTLLRQKYDMRQSDTYADNVAPSLANYETNPVDLEMDLTNVRSQIQNLMNRNGATFPVGDWYQDVIAPTTFEGGSKRGVNELGQQLHDLERKRVLRDVHNLTDVVVSASQNWEILLIGELPTNTTAAVGLVTTLGTVVAFHTGVFGAHSLDEVSGGDAISPRNLLAIVDGATRDPILSGQRIVYGLLQTETATDGHTMTGTTPVRAQISFVRVNAAGNDLEACPIVDIEGKTINYASRERVALESLTEYDFLRGAVVDTPTSVTVTRQVGYDNQGVTPVDLTTNATLDLEGAGLIWAIRDDLEAALFRIIEGSAGGTSEVEFGADVDLFDNRAVQSNFLNGASFDTTGTPIQIAEAAGLIERAADLRIYASGAGELYLDDSNQTGSTWAQTAGVKLSDTTAEWDAYEVAFGGEVSLLNALVQAYNASPDPIRAFHVSSATITANSDVGGPGTAAANLDVNFPDGFVTAGILNTHLYLNGRLMHPGTNAAANHDYYPGTSFTAGNVELKFERVVGNGDQLASYVY